MVDTTEFWEGYGILDGVEEEKKSQLVIQCNKIAEYLANKKMDEHPTCCLIFAVIKKLYLQIDKPDKFAFIIDVIDLFWNLEKAHAKFLKEYSEFFTTPRTGELIVFVDNYCEDFIEDLKKRYII